MGKYDEVNKRLPDLPIIDQPYQEKVEQVKKRLTEEIAHTPESLARLYIETRRGQAPKAGLAEIVIHLEGRQHIHEERSALIELLGKDGLEDLLYECNLKIEALSQLLIESEDNDEPGWGLYGARANTVRLPDGTSVSVQEEPSCKVEDREKFRQWCLKNGYENALQLWPSTTEAITRDRLVRGMPEPDGVVAYRRRKIVPRRKGGEE